MPRNLFERCEVVFPVRDAATRERIHEEILPALLTDTIKARLLQPDGTYSRASEVLKDREPFSSQDFLMQLAEGKVDLDAIPDPVSPDAMPKKDKRPAKRASRKAVAAD